jgi:LuxR family maltose regulon positive regulatory protein
MQTPLLTTKFHIPQLHPGLVARRRLTQRLDEALRTGHRLLLICAPAGFGKTTLLSEWVAVCGIPVAWVSLDRGDNDLVRFWSYTVAALRTIHEGIGESILKALRAPQPPTIESLLPALLNEIAKIPDSFALILDDFSMITDQSIHDALNFFLNNLPSQMHLVLSSRDDPPWPLARLRARGEMTELREADLRFTPEETTRFLNQVMELDLPPEDVAALDARTEGWIAGLQMAAISMRGHRRTRDVPDLSGFIRTFTGSHRFILDYLVEEVLDQQPSAIQRFLVETSILERMSAPLCDAVRFGSAENADRSAQAATTGADAVRFGVAESADRSAQGATAGADAVRVGSADSPSASARTAVADSLDSQSILIRLQKANLFVVPLDNERHWYRYHHLFRDLLRSRLGQIYPSQISALHRRASKWYEENGLIPEAVGHALEAEDFEQVAHLVQGNALAMLDDGGLGTLVRRLDALPNELVRSQPWLCLAKAWSRVYTGPLDAVEPLLCAAEQALAEGKQRPEGVAAGRGDVGQGKSRNEQIVARITAIRTVVASMSGDHARAMELAIEALERLPEDALMVRGLVEAARAGALRQTGRLTAAARAYARAATVSEVAAGQHIAVYALCELAGLRLFQGQLHNAATAYRDALDLTEAYLERTGRRPLVSGYIFAQLSQVLLEWNDLDGAIQHVREGVKLCQEWGTADAVVFGCIDLARVLQALGDTSAALDAIQKAKSAAWDLSPWFVDQVAAAEMRLRLQLGEVAGASKWAQETGLKVDDELSFDRELMYRTLVRILIAQGRLDDALKLLERLLRMAEPAGAMGCVLEMLILQAMAYQACGEVDEALTILERALVFAEPEGYVRMFVDEGPPMGRLLWRAVGCGISPRYASQLLAALDTEVGDRERKVAPLPLSLGEPLSEREMDVLRLLPTHLSTPEMAEELIISVHTVRHHVKNIYRKLDVHTRMDAIGRAKRLGLL